jgi:hypothetical protein
MRRRDFLKFIGAGTAAWPPLAVDAQQPDRMRLVGVLIGWSEGDPATQSFRGIPGDACEAWDGQKAAMCG